MATAKGGRRSSRYSRRSRRNSRRHTRKAMPWAGWGKLAPKGHARTVMKRRCGKKCFLGPRKSFPVCAKGTCKVNSKGLYAAYIRSRQWGKKSSSYKGKSRPSMRQSVYNRISRKAKRMLRRRGYKVGGKTQKGGEGGIGNFDIVQDATFPSSGNTEVFGGRRHKKRCSRGTSRKLVGQKRRMRNGVSNIVRRGHLSKRCYRK